MPQHNVVFISYSHHDQSWSDRLRVHLRPLERRHQLVIWSDSRIEPGEQWRNEIAAALASTRVAVLLVSADFLSSDFITNDELPPLLKAAQEGGTTILPLIVSPCGFLRTESLRHYQSVNDPNQPLIKLSRGEQEEVLERLAGQIDQVFSEPSSVEAAPTEKSSKTTAKQKTVAIRSFNPRYIFETFVESKSNSFALAAAKSVAENPSLSYNPLFVFGGIGIGKTHLLHAIGNAIQHDRPQLRVLYVAAEQFVNELINSIRFDHMQDFRERYRMLDVLMIDDVHFIANKERTQEEFFHTFNALFSDQKQIILTSDSSPRDIPALAEKLRSRFESGLIANIQPPDMETKVAILHRKALIEGVGISDDVAEFIAQAVKSNVRELEGLLFRVLAYSSLTGRAASLSLARETLKDILPEEGKKPAAAEIIKLVARQFDIKVSELKSKSNLRQIVFPRQVAMYLCKQMTDLSYQEIGRLFNDKHHSSVMYSVGTIQKRRDSDPDFDRTLLSFERHFT